jgi:hypothetical protein
MFCQYWGSSFYKNMTIAATTLCPDIREISFRSNMASSLEWERPHPHGLWLYVAELMVALLDNLPKLCKISIDSVEFVHGKKQLVTVVVNRSGVSIGDGLSWALALETRTRELSVDFQKTLMKLRGPRTNLSTKSNEQLIEQMLRRVNLNVFGECRGGTDRKPFVSSRTRRQSQLVLDQNGLFALDTCQLPPIGVVAGFSV